MQNREFIVTILWCINDYLKHIEIVSREFSKLYGGDDEYITCSPYDMTILKHILHDTMKADTTDKEMEKRIFAALLTVESFTNEDI